MLAKALQWLGLPSWLMYDCSLGSVRLCLGLRIRAKTIDQDRRSLARLERPVETRL